MFFFDTSNQNYRVPAAPVFNQSFPPPGQGLTYYPVNELQGYNVNDIMTQKHLQQRQSQMFTLPQQRGQVITAPLSPPTLMWSPNNVYSTPSVMRTHDDGVPHFSPQKNSDGSAVQAMQPLFIPPPQIGSGPLVYMLTPVTVPQSYTQTSLPEHQQQHSSNATPILRPLVLHESATSCLTLSQSATSTEELRFPSPTNTPDSEDLATTNKASEVNVNVVCRHFIKSCCNRRKCRFLHTPEDVTISNV